MKSLSGLFVGEKVGSCPEKVDSAPPESYWEVMMRLKSCVLVLTGLLALDSSVALADVRLPALISDNMVLQQGVRAPIWGWADPSILSGAAGLPAALRLAESQRDQESLSLTHAAERIW